MEEEYNIKKKLKKLGNKEFSEDIKRYIKSPYEFYGIKVPELRTLAKRLHEEHSLDKFYKTFNKLWKSGYHEEMSLALHTLQLYEKEFNLKTWNFIKPKLKDIKSWDQADAIATEIIGPILIKEPKLKKEIIKMSKNKNFWIRRIAIVSTLLIIKQNNISLTMNLAKNYLTDKEPYIQKATGWMIREAGKQKPKEIETFIKKNINKMYPICFSYSTEKMLELRELRKQN
jgi:3-methyladenine DNA glycosylase AlkD